MRTLKEKKKDVFLMLKYGVLLPSVNLDASSQPFELSPRVLLELCIKVLQVTA